MNLFCLPTNSYHRKEPRDSEQPRESNLFRFPKSSLTPSFTVLWIQNQLKLISIMNHLHFRCDFQNLFTIARKILQSYHYFLIRSAQAFTFHCSI